VRIRATAPNTCNLALNEVELYNTAGTKISLVSASSANPVWVESRDSWNYVASHCTNGEARHEMASHWVDVCHSAQDDITFGYQCSEGLSSVVVTRWDVRAAAPLHADVRFAQKFP
jgi:hypothetical protein